MLITSLVGSRLLVVEDEDDLRHTLEVALGREGFDVVVAADGTTALEAAARAAPDLIVLDLMLPDVSGTQVCRSLRERDDTRDTPVIMLTARDEEIDRVVGFEVGADDYVTKPFSMRELILRIRARLRRTSATPAVESHVVGPLKLDPAAHRAWVEGSEVSLTALEFKLLRTLLERRGRVQSRDVLLTDVWELTSEVATRTVDTHIKRLREKLGAAGSYIETVRGVGYRFLERSGPGD